MPSESSSAPAAGGTIPGLSRAAYRLRAATGAAIPVLIAVPHAGRAYPPDVADRMRHGEAAMHRLEDRHVDAVARAAAAACGASLLLAEAPRAMIDLNRDTADIDTGMFEGPGPSGLRGSFRRGAGHRSARGLGLFPRRLSGLGELWSQAMSAQEAERRISAIHAPYHAALGSVLRDIAEQWGGALLIDLHSMPSLPAPKSGAPAASHVVGDRFGSSCARFLSEAAVGVIEGGGHTCAYNRPYAGGYVLDRHGAPRAARHALQIEIDRACYLDADGEIDVEGVARQASTIADLAHALAALLMDDLQQRQAAE